MSEIHALCQNIHVCHLKSTKVQLFFFFNLCKKLFLSHRVEIDTYPLSSNYYIKLQHNLHISNDPPFLPDSQTNEA